MRKILFRGKILYSWVYGSLVNIENECVIMPEYARYYGGSDFSHGYEVEPETVCQSIGMYDRHQTLVFENDIVEFVGGSTRRYLIWWCRECNMMTAIPLDGIYFNGQDYGNGTYPNFNYSTFCLMMQDPYGDFSDIKVIGNIYDNPELLEGCKNYDMPMSWEGNEF